MAQNARPTMASTKREKLSMMSPIVGTIVTTQNLA
jgi:hypothetical protein